MRRITHIPCGIFATFTGPFLLLFLAGFGAGFCFFSGFSSFGGPVIIDRGPCVNDATPNTQKTNKH